MYKKYKRLLRAIVYVQTNEHNHSFSFKENWRWRNAVKDMYGYCLESEAITERVKNYPRLRLVK